MEEKMNAYEAMFLFKTKDAKEDWDGLVDHVGTLVSEASGNVKSATKWDEKKLAFDIKGQSRATYMLVYFDGPPTSVETLHQRCKLSDKVLRVLVVKDDGSGQEEVREPKPAAAPAPAEENTDDTATASPAEAAGETTNEDVTGDEVKEEEESDGVPQQGISDRESDEGPGA